VQRALAFQTFVGEVERFASAKKVASYFVLAPRERSSGNRRQLGHITKEGDSLMRHLLVEAALIAGRGGYANFIGACSGTRARPRRGWP